MRAALKAVSVASAVSVLSLTAYFAQSSHDPIDKAAMQLLVELEGIELVSYVDTAGWATCGVGHLLRPGEKCPATLGAAMKLLADDTRGEVLRQGEGIITRCEPSRSEGGIHLQCRMRRLPAQYGKEVDRRGPNGVSS